LNRDENNRRPCDANRRVVETGLKERHGERVPLEIADSALTLDSAQPEITVCPAFY
jgi:hypothetical protein